MFKFFLFLEKVEHGEQAGFLNKCFVVFINLQAFTKTLIWFVVIVVVVFANVLKLSISL